MDLHHERDEDEVEEDLGSGESEFRVEQVDSLLFPVPVGTSISLVVDRVGSHVVDDMESILDHDIHNRDHEDSILEPEH